MESTNIETSKLNTSLDTNNKIQIADTEFQFSNELKNFESTGYTVIVNVPIAKDSTNPLFLIDALGFIPTFYRGKVDHDEDPDNAWGRIVANESMVQPFEGSSDFVKILRTSKYPLSQLMYDLDRYVTGCPRLAIKISSSTNIAGNLFVTEASGVYKNFIMGDRRYLGFTSANYPLNNYLSDKNSFITVDASLNRTLKINPMGRKLTRCTDMSLLKWMIANDDTDTYKTAFSQYFPRDVIIVGLATGITTPSETAAQLELEIFADWSTVFSGESAVPIFAPTLVDPQKQILKITDSFYNKVPRNVGIRDGSLWLPSE